MGTSFNYIAILTVVMLVLGVYFFACLKAKGGMKIIGFAFALLALLPLMYFFHILWSVVFGAGLIIGVILHFMTGGSKKQTEIPEEQALSIRLAYGEKNGRRASGELILHNPTFILVYGGSNAGKTTSIGKPVLAEYMRNQVALFCYDAKENDFTNTAFKLKEDLDYPHPIYNANFADPSRGYRFNPIKADSIADDSYVEEYMKLFYVAYAQKTKLTEWDTMALGLLKGVAYVLYKKYPRYFSFPHITNFIIHNSNEHILAFLNLTPESRGYASAFLDAVNSSKTLASIKSTLTSVIGPFAANKKICYVLNGNDFDFNLVDPKAPKAFFVSNNFDLRAQISPLVVLLFIIATRKIKFGNTVPLCIFMDEGTTFEIPNFEEYPSELREYKVNFVLLTQSPAKIEKTYDSNSRSSLEANGSTQFIGNTQDDKALTVFENKFSKIEQFRKSVTRSSGGGRSSKSVTRSPQEKAKHDRDFFQNLRQGEFVGRTRDTAKPGEFHYRFLPYQGGKLDNPPLVEHVTSDIIEENYHNIIHDVTREIFDMKAATRYTE